jgi:hypothetical protein
MGEKKTTSTLLPVALVGLLMLGVGLAVGFVFGSERGKSQNARDKAQAVARAEDADSARAAAVSDLAAEKKVTEGLRKEGAVQQEQVIAAKRQTDDAEGRVRAAKEETQALLAEAKKVEANRLRLLAEQRANQNDLIIKFKDNPEKYNGEELTGRLCHERSQIYGEAKDLREYVKEFKDEKTRLCVVKFWGSDSLFNRIEIVIAIPAKLDLPAAAPGDDLGVTFTLVKNSEGQMIGMASKVIRHKR